MLLPCPSSNKLPEIVIQRGPRDAGGHCLEDPMQDRIEVTAVVGLRYQRMPDIQFSPVTGLSALQLFCAASCGLIHYLFPQTKKEEPVALVGIIQPDELVDHAFSDAKA